MTIVNRTDRLYAIHEELRRLGTAGATAARLADLFEVSIRTIKRDVSALQQTGAPIWAQTGPGGGYVLSGPASLPPLNFTASQAVAVTVALAALPSGSPFAVDATTASKKLSDALNATELARARALAARIWVLPPAADQEPAKPTVVRAVERALVDRLAVALVYQSADETVTRRVVEPVILGWVDGTWYLVAHCQLRDDIRWFRLSRIQRADVTRQSYRPRPVEQIGTPPPNAASLEQAGTGKRTMPER